MERGRKRNNNNGIRVGQNVYDLCQSNRGGRLRSMELSISFKKLSNIEIKR